MTEPFGFSWLVPFHWRVIVAVRSRLQFFFSFFFLNGFNSSHFFTISLTPKWRSVRESHWPLSLAPKSSHLCRDKNRRDETRGPKGERGRIRPLLAPYIIIDASYSSVSLSLVGWLAWDFFESWTLKMFETISGILNGVVAWNTHRHTRQWTRGGRARATGDMTQKCHWLWAVCSGSTSDVLCTYK